MPLEGMDNTNKSWGSIYEEIKKFISPESDTNNNKSDTYTRNSYEHFKAVFSMPNDLAETNFGMDFLYDRYCTENKNKSKCLNRAADKVLNLETLVNNLAKIKVI